MENNTQFIAPEETTDIRRYIGFVFAYWWLILTLPILGGLGGYYYSAQQDPVYEARGVVLVQYRGSGLSALGVSDFNRSEQLAATYKRLITAQPFLERVSDRDDVDLSINQLSSALSADISRNPPLISVKVRFVNSDIARSVAQAVSVEFIDYAIDLRLAEIARLQSVALAQGLANVQDFTAAQFTAVDSLQLLEDVKLPSSPVTPRTQQNILLGGMIGVFLSILIAITLESMKDTVRSPEQLARRFGVSSLGTLFRWSSGEVEQGILVLKSAPTSGYAEALRQIRANVQFSTMNLKGNALLVTSPGAGEGKSTMIANLAVAVAQTGKKVILVDGDLRRPSVHRLFSTVNREPGLSNYLANMGPELKDIVTQSEDGDVDVIPSGPTPPNPSELLGSKRMSDLLIQLRNEYDQVFVDSPPLLPVADGAILGDQMDGAIIVVDAFGTRSASLDVALGALRRTNVNILGVIINKLRTRRFGYDYQYPYYYYYAYRQYYGQPEDSAKSSGILGIPTRVFGKAVGVFSRKKKD